MAEQEWSQPKARSWRSKKKHATTQRENAQLQDAIPTGIVDGMTVDRLLADFQTMEKRWADSDYAQKIENMLANSGGRTITDAVCIGIGSFSIDWDHRYRSLWQLVLFLAVVKIGK